MFMYLERTLSNLSNIEVYESTISIVSHYHFGV